MFSASGEIGTYLNSQIGTLCFSSAPVMVKLASVLKVIYNVMIIKYLYEYKKRKLNLLTSIVYKSIQSINETLLVITIKFDCF